MEISKFTDAMPYILTIMMGIIGFFLIRLINKIDNIDEKMDTQITKQNEYDYRIKKLEIGFEKHTLNLDELNKKLAILENEHENQHKRNLK